MVAVWDSSETYAHGYVILPLSLWLVWRKRREVASTPIHPDGWALLPALGLSFIWLAGRLVGAQVVEHYVLVGLMIVSVWTLFGRALMNLLFFPLLYLLLMVPAGDSLIEPMVHFTADFTVSALRLIGIPVLQDGTFLELPSGQWSVVEACSGIRYFLSSIVLGWLYAYLTYRTWWKRMCFGVAAIIVPVFANGLRATIIVLLGHYSGMTLAIGVDHLIYGWVWFGVVMLILFWVGNYWREDDESFPQERTNKVLEYRPAYALTSVMLMLVAIFPLYERQLASAPPLSSPLARWVPPANWHVADSPITTWQPRWVGMDDRRVLHLQSGGKVLMVYLGWYGAQRQGAELINSQNVLVPEKDPDWRNLYESVERVAISGQPMALRQARLQDSSTGQRLLVWYWHHINGNDGISHVEGKFRLALSKLLGLGNAASGVIVAAPYDDQPAEAAALLTRFLEEAKGPLGETLDVGSKPR